MIQSEENAGGGDIIHIGNVQLPSKERRYRPNSNYLRLQYEKPGKFGEIILPHQAKGLEWVTAVVLDVGPEVKHVKPGDRILIAVKGIIGGHEGLSVDGVREHFSQENLVVSVIE